MNSRNTWKETTVFISYYHVIFLKHVEKKIRANRLYIWIAKARFLQPLISIYRARFCSLYLIQSVHGNM